MGIQKARSLLLPHYESHCILIHRLQHLIIVSILTNVVACLRAPQFEQSSLASADQQGHHRRGQGSQGHDVVALWMGSIYCLKQWKGQEEIISVIHDCVSSTLYIPETEIKSTGQLLRECPWSTFSHTLVLEAAEVSSTDNTLCYPNIVGCHFTINNILFTIFGRTTVSL